MGGCFALKLLDIKLTGLDFLPTQALLLSFVPELDCSSPHHHLFLMSVHRVPATVQPFAVTCRGTFTQAPSSVTYWTCPSRCFLLPLESLSWPLSILPSPVLTNPFGPAWCDLACNWNSSKSWASWSHSRHCRSSGSCWHHLSASCPTPLHNGAVTALPHHSDMITIALSRSPVRLDGKWRL